MKVNEVLILCFLKKQIIFETTITLCWSWNKSIAGCIKHSRDRLFVVHSRVNLTFVIVAIFIS